MILAIIFWLSVIAMFHSYVLYPLLLKLFSIGKRHNDNTFSRNENLPVVYVLMSVYNEETVIHEKLKSVLDSDYPPDKLIVYVGSDGSTDKTNKILDSISNEYSNFRFKNFEGRVGKSSILNRLVELVSEQQSSAGINIYIFTDANVIFTPSTIFELVKHYKNPGLAVVGANILNKALNKKGISIQEKSYIERENHIKYLEGLNWGTMMGAFGACYAIKSNFFDFIPKNFLMEDFYITMNALKKKGISITEPQAICYEDVSDDIFMEFDRKVRISAGNYQNLSVFYKLLFPVFSPLSFSFLSHKLLRWMGPLFILAAFVSCLWLARTSNFYLMILIVQFILFIIPLFDYLLKKANVHLVLFKFITYFYFMNLALLTGFIMYLKGINTNVWEPTKRNQF